MIRINSKYVWNLKTFFNNIFKLIYILIIIWCIISWIDATLNQLGPHAYEHSWNVFNIVRKLLIEG